MHIKIAMICVECEDECDTAFLVDMPNGKTVEDARAFLSKNRIHCYNCMEYADGFQIEEMAAGPGFEPGSP